MKKKRTIIAGIPMSLAKLTIPLFIWIFLIVIVLKNKELIAEICLAIFSIALIRAMLFDILIVYVKHEHIFIGNPINPFTKRLKTSMSSIQDFDYHVTKGSRSLHFLSVIQSVDDDLKHYQWVKNNMLMQWEVQMLKNYANIPVSYRNDNIL